MLFRSDLELHDLEVRTGDMVQFRHGRSSGSGRGLVARLKPRPGGQEARGPQAGPMDNGPNIGGVDTIRLDRDVRMRIEGLAGGMLPGGPAAPRPSTETAESAADHLATSRPTAVNLFWALNRMRRRARDLASQGATDLPLQLLREAQAIEAEDQAMCRAIGFAGAALLPADCGEIGRAHV